MTARMEYRDTNKKDANKQKAWKEAVINYKATQEQLKTTREGYYRCDSSLSAMPRNAHCTPAGHSAWLKLRGYAITCA